MLSLIFFFPFVIGEEKSPVERTGSVIGAGTSPGTHNLTSVRNAGQRVSVSPIDVSSVGYESPELPNLRIFL